MNASIDITVFVRSEPGGRVCAWAEGKDAGQSTGIGPFADNGVAMFPQRYDAFGAICTWVENQLIRGHLSVEQSASVQGLLGAPWPHKKLAFTWADTHPDSAPHAGAAARPEESGPQAQNMNTLKTGTLKSCHCNDIYWHGLPCPEHGSHNIRKEKHSPSGQHPTTELGNADAQGHASLAHPGERSTAPKKADLSSPESLPQLALELWRELDSLDWSSHQNAICGMMESYFKRAQTAAQPGSGTAGEFPSISAETRKEWRTHRSEGMISVLGEYTPSEFWDLLDAYEQLLATRAVQSDALRELRELSEKATAGPWMEWSIEGYDGRGIEKYSVCYAPNGYDDDPKHQCVLETRGSTNVESKANQQFIVACVNYVRSQLSSPATTDGPEGGG